MLRCCQFYIANQDNHYFAPSDNLKKNNLKAIIGNTFLEWAEDYFDEERLNIEINKKELMDNCKASCGHIKLNNGKIQTKLEQFCTLKGYLFSGTIKKTEYIGQTRTTVQYLCVSTPNTPTAPTTVVNTPNTESSFTQQVYSLMDNISNEIDF